MSRAIVSITLQWCNDCELHITKRRAGWLQTGMNLTCDGVAAPTCAQADGALYCGAQAGKKLQMQQARPVTNSVSLQGVMIPLAEA